MNCRKIVHGTLRRDIEHNSPTIAGLSGRQKQLIINQGVREAAEKEEKPPSWTKISILIQLNFMEVAVGTTSTIRLRLDSSSCQLQVRHYDLRSATPALLCLHS